MKGLLIGILLFLGISAVFGGIGLIFNDGLSMPKDWLSNSPFNSYLIPGLILTFIVGGTSFGASYMLLKNMKNSIEGAAVAGFGVIIWIFVQRYIIRQSSFLQIVYFAVGILIVALSILLLIKQGSFKK